MNPRRLIALTKAGIMESLHFRLGIFVTLFAAGVIPAPVLIASCISQDGHASLPLLAESKGAFIRAKAINCVVALIVGLTAWWITI